MSKKGKTPGKPPVDEDVLYLDADDASQEDSLENILKEAQASAERLAERHKAKAPDAATAPAAAGGPDPTAATAPAAPSEPPPAMEMEEIVEEVVEEAPPEANALALQVAELSSENERLKLETRELRDAVLRKQAEFENFRKRMQRDKEDFEKYSNGALLKEILPVLDNLERALMVESSADVASLRQGVELVFRQLRDGLARYGLKEVVAIGQEFDPNVHEAVASDPDSDLPSNTVVAELQKGYLHHDRLLRAAFVKVAMGTKPAAPPPPGDGDGGGRPA